MNPYSNEPQDSKRQRRSNRYTAEYVGEPSMNAPLPMPTGKIAEGRRSGAAQQPSDWQQSYPAQSAHPQQGYSQQARSDWSQPYPVRKVQADWSQNYQPVQENNKYRSDWSQPYQQTPQSSGWNSAYSQQPPAGWPTTYQAKNAYEPVTSAPAQVPAKNQSGLPSWLKRVLLATTIVIVAAAAVFGVIAAGNRSAMEQAVRDYDARFCEGVFVDGIHLGGMTQEQAANEVAANATQRMQNWKVQLTQNNGVIREIRASDLGMTINVNDALEAAWEQGHATGNVDERKAAMDALLQEPYYGSTALPSGDTSVLNRILNEIAAAYYVAPQDATVIFDNAARSNPFDITPEQPGYYLDVAEVKQELYRMVERMESGAIELPLKTLQPAVTADMLRSQRVLRGSALTEISTTSTENRTENIRRAFELINGTVLKPGESFSFNNIVGPRSAKNGFHLAIEYAYGQEREGYGGGVCQASTTVYLAAVRANMNITKRTAHSDKVNYTEYGLDATVNLDGKKIDLAFKNTTNSDVYILAYLIRANGRWNCKVDIYGEAHEEGVTYDLIAETVEVLPAPTDPEYLQDKTGEHVVYIDDEPVQKRKASDGVIVETFKVKYLNGKEVDRTYVARDTYKAKAQQLWVGVSEREDPWMH